MNGTVTIGLIEYESMKAYIKKLEEQVKNLNSIIKTPEVDAFLATLINKSLNQTK